MIHTVELLFSINYQEVQYLFSTNGINIARFNHFGGAVKQLKESMKKPFPAYSVTWISYQGEDNWNLHIKVDVLRILGRGNFTEKDYKLVEVDICKFLIKQFGHSLHFDQHTLTRIDYRLDVIIPNKNNQNLIFHLFEKYTEKYGHKKKLNGARMKMGNPSNMILLNTTNQRALNSLFTVRKMNVVQKSIKVRTLKLNRMKKM